MTRDAKDITTQLYSTNKKNERKSEWKNGRLDHVSSTQQQQKKRPSYLQGYIGELYSCPIFYIDFYSFISLLAIFSFIS